MHILIFLAVCAALAAAVMLLWNALIPEIIGWSAIGYWQSLGLMVLCRLLLGGLGHMNNWKQQHAGKTYMYDIHRKMCNMSKDERREFIRRRMEGFCEPDKTDMD